MPTRELATSFAREVDMYPPLLELFSRTGSAIAEVPFFGKRIDLVFGTPTLRSLHAVETKLRDWRSAFKQAALNQLATQRSYIAVPSSFAVRLMRSEEDLFRRYDVGLVAVDEAARVLIPPKRNGCFSLRHYHVLKRTLKTVQSISPRTLGVVANAISSRSDTLVVLQTRAN